MKKKTYHMLSIKRFWSEVENYAKELEYDFTRIEDIAKVMGLQQEDKQHETFNIILLIAKIQFINVD